MMSRIRRSQPNISINFWSTGNIAPSRSFKGLLILTTIFVINLFGLYLPNLSPIHAHTLEPYIKEYVVYPGQTFDDAVNFTNSNDTVTTFKISVENYDGIKEKPIKDNDENIFIVERDPSLTFEPETPTEVRYDISVPSGTAAGTYFNILYLEELSEDLEEGQNVGINLGFGMITVFHVIPEGSSTRELLRNTIGTQLQLTQRGLPYIQESQIEYTMENRSNFVIKPTVEIRIFDAETDQLLYTDKRDQSELATLSAENRTLSIPLSVQLFDINNFTHGFKVVSRSYSQLDTEYVQNTLMIPGYPVISIAIALLVLLILIWVIIKLASRVVSRKNRTTSEKGNATPKGKNKKSDK